MIRDLAARLLDARDAGRQIVCPSAGPDFVMATARAVRAEVTRLRIARGERVAGVKIGFTNRRIRAEYGVDAPIWGPVWDTTVHTGAMVDGGHARLPDLPLAAIPEPQIEPEIILRLGRQPEPGMDIATLWGCVEAVSHGFEIVSSPFPGWRFSGADTVAGFALHAALLPGPWVRLVDTDALMRFSICLACDGAEVDAGTGTAVLGGGPLAALAHLVSAEDPPDLGPGSLVSTGTLTRAHPVRAGQVWTTALSGLDLPGLHLRLG